MVVTCPQSLSPTSASVVLRLCLSVLGALSLSCAPQSVTNPSGATPRPFLSFLLRSLKRRRPALTLARLIDPQIWSTRSNQVKQGTMTGVLR